MTFSSHRILFSLILLFGGAFLALPARGIDHDHAQFTRILDRLVEDKRVDYGALKKDPTPLNTYLGTLAAVKKSEFETWNENQQLAFLFNLYNAATLKLIIDRYPVSSIKKIGNVFRGPWKQEVVRLFGETTTLDHLEHGIVRKQYKEPRAHFALVCAALGCPPLREEAYRADVLDRQLEDQGRVFLNNKIKNRVDHGAGILYLSPIFDWFKEDFTGGGKSLGDWVAPYLEDERDRKAAASGRLGIRFTEYDWSLNDR